MPPGGGAEKGGAGCTGLGNAFMDWLPMPECILCPKREGPGGMVCRGGGGPPNGLGGLVGPPCMPTGPKAGGPLLNGPPGPGPPPGEVAKGPGRRPGGAIGLEEDGGGWLLPGGPPPVGRLEAMKGGNAACGGPLGGGIAPLGTTPGGGAPGNGDEGKGCGRGWCPKGGGGPLGPPPEFGG